MINIIQGHDFSLCISNESQVGSANTDQLRLSNGEKKAGNTKISDQICKLVSVKRMIDEGL